MIIGHQTARACAARARLATALGLGRVPRALLLDFDDTLVPSSAAYATALAAVGIEPAGAAFRAARAAVKARMPTGDPSAHQRLLYFKEMQARGTLPGRGPAALLAVHARYEDALHATLHAAWQRLGRAALLAALRRTWPICVVTNETSRTQLGKWAAVDPEGLALGSFLVSDEVGHDKPHRAPFAAAAEALGCAPADCLFVGDSLAHDVVPSLALGMQAAWATEFLPARAAASPCPPAAARLVALDQLHVP